MTRAVLAMLALAGLALVSGTAADVGAACGQNCLQGVELICPGDRPPQVRPCRPWNMYSLRALYTFGNAEQRASAEKAIDDIWAGRNGWCPVR
jgi:hypothetical protein